MATDNVYVPEEGARARLDAWLATSDGPVLAHLWTNNFVYLPTKVLADFVEASFVGYAQVGPIVWPPAATNPQGKAQSDSPNLTWTFTAGSGTALVRGLYLTDDPPTKVLCAVPFRVPVTLTPAVPSLARSVALTDVSEL